MSLGTLSLGAVLLMATSASAHFIGVGGNNSIDGSLCVGGDCVAEESFGFDTVRLKENNLRMNFVDTSVAASFPTNDWRIVINDSANGGASYFGVEDSSAGRIPFRVSAGARNHALFVDSQGDVGIGTSTPATDIDIKTGDSPTVRLQQDGSSGFQPQTWDMAGNETNFFIRDATNGSQLPFRIRPEAPTNSLFIAPDGDIGMGTASPDGPLHINNDSVFITLEDTNDDDKWFFTHAAANDGNFEITNELDGSGTFTLAFVLEPGGDATLAGSLTENSDKNNKMAIEPIDSDEVLEKVAALPVSTWTYKHDAEDGIRHIGPMAQDFYALFGTGASEKGISTLDTSGVALAAIKALHAENERLRSDFEALKALIEAD